MEKTKVAYPQLKALDFNAIEQSILEFWRAEKIFEQSITSREGQPQFTFYEGPPSANGHPGIHHVMARAIKDIFCRYKTLKGYQVKRKAGWDTHGLPVELQVEKQLGITKKDIGTKISVAEYNAECRKTVMMFTDHWNELTERMGYWVDMQDPYITYENNYIESVWHLLKKLYDKDLLYKGYTIQPYSPAAGTGLSSHELNLPGCYRNVKDTTCVAMFKVEHGAGMYFLAWTTTPWTLPSNAALAVGKNIEYARVRTINPYTHQKIDVILAKALLSKYFAADCENINFDTYKNDGKKIPWTVCDVKKGSEYVGYTYEQLMPYVTPSGKAFQVIEGDFVSTEDGTGIVHIAPTFGADDMRVAKQAGIVEILISDELTKNDSGSPKFVPLVDTTGKFPQIIAQQIADEFIGLNTDTNSDYLKALSDKLNEIKNDGIFVRNEYSADADYPDVNEVIRYILQLQGKLFKHEKYEHNYPHCWRTDKPILYYPLDSWFIKTSAHKARMAELNKTINWKPESTGTGRFGNWLENLVDWNLSRSRYWGIPLPVWRSVDGKHIKCVGSIAELKAEADKAIKAGLMTQNPVNDDFDLHRPYIDELTLVAEDGTTPLYREKDLIDVWFDSGAMPYAQWHHPFENQDIFKKSFPADYIAEGVDQTRGWFFTLHAIAVLTEDSVAYKNVIANGLVLDKDGNKMSKRLGNTVEPFETLKTYGADPTRWYMVENSPPWENLKFNLDNLVETQRRFYGTLFNTYNFFALYANIDNFVWSANKTIPVEQRTELDRWILSLLNSLVNEVDKQYADYDPTRVARAIQHFVVENLSNWYVRLGRRRFWKGGLTTDKQAAYETLFECLTTVAQLMSPISPFFGEWLYKSLTDNLRDTEGYKLSSVHLSSFPVSNPQIIDNELETRMQLAQDVCSLVRSIRSKVNIKIRQPLQKVMVPVLTDKQKEQLAAITELVINEVNVKELQIIDANSGVITKKIKPDFKKLGPRFGAGMKVAAGAIADLTQEDINTLQKTGQIAIQINDAPFELTIEDVEIVTDDLPGWSVASDGKVTVALDITLNEALKEEGIAREFVNRIQNLRKDLDFEVTDHIRLQIKKQPVWQRALNNFKEYICTETLADSFELLEELEQGIVFEIDDITTSVNIYKI